ncbi:esterase family protein [Azospirillum sp. B4]|uniref:alpha/beta hydrolase n=1 Tax=Azospirillum sp. B4 TaxID=95605 RepID=UPI000A2F85A4|nr:alpha/beta hydrolase-fold protein [Azospirillum sp. B4]
MTSALLLSFSATAASAAQPACEERSFMQPPLFYSSVDPQADGRVTFRLCAKGIHEARVFAGEVNGVPIGLDGTPPGLAMALDDQGYWSATTPVPVAPGVYTYAFKVDGLRVADPQGARFAEGFGGPQSVFEIAGPEVANQLYKADVAHGLVSVVDYQSASLGIRRRAHVYTPPGYEAGGKERYPVLYLVHGYSDSDDAWTAKGNANAILDNLIAAGKVKPMIVVMPQGHTPMREGMQGLENTDFGADLHKDLIPYIDAHFRTIAKPASRAMAGLSMGGAHTIQFGLPRPDVFGSVGVFSIGLFGDDQVARYLAANDASLKARAKSGGLVYYAVGKSDPVFNGVAPVRKVLDQYGIAYVYNESAGGHTWINWRAYLEDFTPRLFH